MRGERKVEELKVWWAETEWLQEKRRGKKQRDSFLSQKVLYFQDFNCYAVLKFRIIIFYFFNKFCFLITPNFLQYIIMLFRRGTARIYLNTEYNFCAQKFTWCTVKTFLSNCSRDKYQERFWEWRWYPTNALYGNS